MTTQKLCIYHANCQDGFGAALAVYSSIKWGSKTQFHPAHYGSPPPDVKGKDVIIVDFSYPRETLEKMRQQANSLQVIDHHKTAQADLDGLDYCLFDMTQSGAMLTWKALFPATPDFTPIIPDLIHFIQDRDLWRWEHPRSREYSAALSSLPMDFEVWGALLNNNETTARMWLEGEAILRYQQKQVDTIVESWKKTPRYITLPDGKGEWTVPLANVGHLISETCGELSKGYPFACTYFDTGNQRIYSLRRRDGETIDVSAIAKYIADTYSASDRIGKASGGGHAPAAGFSLPAFIRPESINIVIAQILDDQ